MVRISADIFRTDPYIHQKLLGVAIDDKPTTLQKWPEVRIYVGLLHGWWWTVEDDGTVMLNYGYEDPSSPSQWTSIARYDGETVQFFIDHHSSDESMTPKQRKHMSSAFKWIWMSVVGETHMQYLWFAQDDPEARHKAVKANEKLARGADVERYWRMTDDC